MQDLKTHVSFALIFSTVVYGIYRTCNASIVKTVSENND